ncbi:MAG TPA: hypothetical protein VKT32_14850 [Chthonomonadaceae bacterium]|nr:hypothetical protein [Chthonomonadaceae bacterium]
MGPVTFWWWSCQAYRRRLGWVAKLLKLVNFVLFKAILPYQAVIERDIQLEHYGLGVVIHPNVTIGHRVRIFHHVTVAAQTWIGSEYRVTIGDDVLIGAGATVLSKTDTNLTIGAGARIGAGAVVTQDVAPGQTVIGIPARPI